MHFKQGSWLPTRVSKQEGKREPARQRTVFCNLISGITFHHLAIFIRSKSLGLGHIGKGSYKVQTPGSRDHQEMFQKLPTQLWVLLLPSNLDLTVSYVNQASTEKFPQFPFVYPKNFTCIVQHRRLCSPCPFTLLGFFLSLPMDPFSLRACMLSQFSHVQFFVTLWTVAHHIPLSYSPGKNTGVGCHAPLKWIFLTQQSNQCLLSLLHQQASSL